MKRRLGHSRIAPADVAPYGFGSVEAKTCAQPSDHRAVRVCIERRGKPGPVVSSPDAVCKVLRGSVERDRESFFVLHLDAKNKVLNIEEAHRGTLSGVEVHPREVFKAAILSNASAVIIAHNHPSGDPTPSSEDVALTKKIVEAGKILGIPVHDHVIVGEIECLSLRERGRSGGFEGLKTRRRKR